MGVYIKGMEMPKEGYVDVRLFSDGRATTQTGERPFYREMKTTEVKEPHGRLIDADALVKDVTENALHDPNNLDWIEISSVIALIAMNAVIERSEDDRT